MFTRKPDKPHEVGLTISTESYVRLAAMIIGTIVLILAVHKASHAVLLLFTAFFLSLALNGPVAWLSKRLPGRGKGSRSLATSISFLIVVLLLGLFIASIVPPLVKQTESFINAAPRLIQEYRNQNSPVGSLIRRYHLQNQVSSVSNQLADRLKNAGGAAFSTVQQIGSSIFSLLTILVLTFMMLVEGPQIIAFFRDIVPDKHHDTADRLAAEMYRVIKGYVNGQVTLAAIASLLILPAVVFLGIPYPVALVVVIFVCGLIPMVGHTIGAVIVTLVALFHSTTSAVIILIYYLVYQQLENLFIQPRIQANSTDMSPLLVFASVIVGISFGGLFGGLFAIPIAGCLRIIILEYLRAHRIISDEEVNETLHEEKPDIPKKSAKA